MSIKGNSIHDVSTIALCLGVEKLEDYPGGIRAAVLKYLEEGVPGGRWTTEEFNELLEAVKTDGFKYIPGCLLKSSAPPTDICSGRLLIEASQQIEQLREIVLFLLDRLEGRE